MLNISAFKGETCDTCRVSFTTTQAYKKHMDDGHIGAANFIYSIDDGKMEYRRIQASDFFCKLVI